MDITSEMKGKKSNLKEENATNPNAPQLSENARKLKELEDKMTVLEQNIADIKKQNEHNRSTKQTDRAEIEEIYQESQKLFECSQKNIADKIKDKFVDEFDIAAKKVVESDKRRNLLEDKLYEYENMIQELDSQGNESEMTIRKLKEQYGDLKSEYDFLKEGYDELAKENSILRMDCKKKDERITILETELHDMKTVIGKLTEVRVILNKYFSAHYENFTPHERRIIEEVQGGIVFGVPPEKKTLEQEGVIEHSHNKTNSNQGISRNPNQKILSEEEYRAYQSNLKNNQKKITVEKEKDKGGVTQNPNANSNTMPNPRGQGNYPNNSNINNSEDDFWYQTNNKYNK